jgi:hypothetical protein
MTETSSTPQDSDKQALEDMQVMISAFLNSMNYITLPDGTGFII